MRLFTRIPNMISDFIFDLVLMKEKLSKPLVKIWINLDFDILLIKVFWVYLRENISFLKFFLSKCLELRAIPMLKISSKSETTFVQCGWDAVELPICHFANVLKILLGKIIVWIKANNIFEITVENSGSLCIFQRFLFTFFYPKISPGHPSGLL